MTTAEKCEVIVTALYLRFMQGDDALSVRDLAEACMLTPTQVSNAAYQDKRLES